MCNLVKLAILIWISNFTLKWMSLIFGHRVSIFVNYVSYQFSNLNFKCVVQIKMANLTKFHNNQKCLKKKREKKKKRVYLLLFVHHKYATFFVLWEHCQCHNKQVYPLSMMHIDPLVPQLHSKLPLLLQIILVFLTWCQLLLFYFWNFFGVCGDWVFWGYKYICCIKWTFWFIDQTFFFFWFKLLFKILFIEIVLNLWFFPFNLLEKYVTKSIIIWFERVIVTDLTFILHT